MYSFSTKDSSNLQWRVASKGPLAQLVERVAVNRKVVGSNPTRTVYKGNWRSGSAAVYGTEGHRFNSYISQKKTLF